MKKLLMYQLAKIESDFKFVEDLILQGEFDNWSVKQLLPKSKPIHEVNEVYLLQRNYLLRDKKVKKATENMKDILSSKDLDRFEIEIEWKKSKVWGWNPTGILRLWDSEGNYFSFTDKVSGYGYDKESAVMGVLMNKSNVLKKMLVMAYEENIFSYGYSYGSFCQSGCGVSSLQDAMEKLGYKLDYVANGKSYDKFVCVLKK